MRFKEGKALFLRASAVDTCRAFRTTGSGFSPPLGTPSRATSEEREAPLSRVTKFHRDRRGEGGSPSIARAFDRRDCRGPYRIRWPHEAQGIDLWRFHLATRQTGSVDADRGARPNRRARYREYNNHRKTELVSLCDYIGLQPRRQSWHAGVFNRRSARWGR